MLTYQFRKGLIRIVETTGQFEENNKKTKADILLRLEFLQSSNEIIQFLNLKNSFCLLEPNYIIDLHQTEEELFMKLHRSAKNPIKKTLKQEDLQYIEIINPSSQELKDFVLFYNKFAKRKQIEECNIEKISAYSEQGSLVIGLIKDAGNDDIISAHTYFCIGDHAYGMYAATKEYVAGDSYKGQLIGRANRYLYWMDIMSCKRKGLKWFNFGGKIINPHDDNGKNINRFKESFGGMNGYNLRIYCPQTFVGWIALNLLRLKFIWSNNPEYMYAKKFLEKSKCNYLNQDQKAIHKEQ